MTDNPPHRARLAPADRHAQLLQCAVAALAEHGVARATHAHVAIRAGVSVAAVHSYFRTRDDLVHAALEQVSTTMRAITFKVAAEKAGARASLLRIVRDFDQAACATPETVKVWLDWSTGFRADVWDRYLVFEHAVQSDVGRILARGKRRHELSKDLNVAAAARLFIGGGRTVALARFAGLSGREVNALILHLVEGIVGFGNLDPHSIP